MWKKKGRSQFCAGSSPFISDMALVLNDYFSFSFPFPLSLIRYNFYRIWSHKGETITRIHIHHYFLSTHYISMLRNNFFLLFLSPFTCFTFIISTFYLLPSCKVKQKQYRGCSHTINVRMFIQSLLQTNCMSKN